MYFPYLLRLYPSCFRDPNYLNFVGNYSIAAGSFIGFILLTLAYLQQEKKFQFELQENEKRKKDEFIERFIRLFENVRGKIKYGNNVGEVALKEFYKNVNIFLNKKMVDMDDFEGFKKNLQIAVDGSSFTKGGSLNLYKRSLDNVINRIYESKSVDLIPFLEDSLSDEEKVLIFYLYSFYFKKSKSYDYLVSNNFLSSIDSTKLASVNHLNWLR